MWWPQIILSKRKGGDAKEGEAEMPHETRCLLSSVTSVTLLSISEFNLCIVIDSYFAVTGTELISIGYDKDRFCKL
jgi:hypothetical protein